jgi:hypothetical protein
MKSRLGIFLLAGLGTALTSCVTPPTAPSPRTSSNQSQTEQVYNAAPESPGAEPTETGWPRAFVSGSATNIIYEPRIDSWDGRELVARVVVAVQNPGQRRTTLGVITIRSLTLVDKNTRTASLENIQILNGDFPSARQQTQQYLQVLRGTFPKELRGLSLDQLEAGFNFTPPQLSGSGQLNNTPPRIFFSTNPAVLVYIDGPPIYRRVSGTGLDRVINTPLLLLKDAAGHYYLHLWDGYLTAPRLEGPWTVAKEPPKGADEAERQATAAIPEDLLRAETPTNPVHLADNTAPHVYVSTLPAELILFEGQPDFVPITGTHLVYVANTTGNVFKLLSDQQTYVLISGRWYRAPSLEGPWQFVAPDRLPPDFAEIPETSPKENVKASIPGTSQATEALIVNSIPDSTKVPRDMQMQDPRIDGAPRLEPIGGTHLSYVVNSGTPIIRVAENFFYACQNGVWFTATSLNGPWRVAVSVPEVIHTIPTTSPLHYLVYVQIYYATDEYVYEGYTPGYLGTEVEGGVVVYGTGYYYTPWIGAVWYGWPCTWGFGWGPCWTPWTSWCFNYGFGCCGHCHPPTPWWGPCRGWHHGSTFAAAWPHSYTAGTAANLYTRTHPANGISPSSTISAFGSTTGFGRAYNSRTGFLAAGQRATVGNLNAAFETRGEPGGHSVRNGFSARGSDLMRGQTGRRNGWHMQYFPKYGSTGFGPRGSGQPGYSSHGGSGNSGGAAHGSAASGGAGHGSGGGGSGSGGGGGGGHGGGGGGASGGVGSGSSGGGGGHGGSAR